MRTALFFAILALLLAVAPGASAHCRKTTAGGDEAYDAARAGKCAGNRSALPLYWTESCIAVQVVVDPELEASGKMTLARASDILHRASTDWAEVKCNGAGGARPVAIRVVDAAREQCPGGAAPNRLNEVRFTAARMHDGLLAVTKVAFDRVNGVVSSANLQVLDIYDDLDVKTTTDLDQRVERVVRHELGHFLGLSHSDNADAVMDAAYDIQRNDGLTADDVAGICDAYSPDQPIGAGCAVASSGPMTPRWIALLPLVAALALCRRRRLSVAVLIAAYSLSHGTVASAAEEGPTKKQVKPRHATPKKPAMKSAEAEPAPLDPALVHESLALLHRQDDTLSLSSSSSPALQRTALLAPQLVRAPTPPPSPEAPIELQPPVRSSDLYIGARYRAYALPAPVAGLFAKSSKDLLFHSVSIEADYHYRRFAIVPALTFADLSTGDMLVGSRSNDLASSFSYVRSDMKAIAGSVGFVWSIPISGRVSFELGLEVGVGVTFGSLVDNWVYETPGGSLDYGGRRFAPCKTVNDGFGCRPQDHDSPKPIRVGNYREPGNIDGGKAPTILPWVSLPLTGVRVRVSDGIAARVGVGASLTGIWAGVSVDYLVAKAGPRSVVTR